VSIFSVINYKKYLKVFYHAVSCGLASIGQPTKGGREMGVRS